MLEISRPPNRCYDVTLRKTGHCDNSKFRY